jgi:hypothetical protein
MLTSAVSISQDGNWTASTGQVYAVFLGIHIIQGFLGCSITKILARLQNIFIIANFAIIIATFAALPATTPKDERNSAQYIFGEWENLTGWVNGFAFIICKRAISVISPLTFSVAFARVEYWWIRLLCPHFRRSIKCIDRCSVGYLAGNYDRRYRWLALCYRHCCMHGDQYCISSCIALWTTHGQYLFFEIGKRRHSSYLELHVSDPICYGIKRHVILQSSDVGLQS